MSFSTNSSLYIDRLNAASVSSLSWLEQIWVDWYAMVGNATVASSLLIALFHETAYFGRCIPWMILDRIPYFNKWKIQPHKTVTPSGEWECTKVVLWGHFCLQLPSVLLQLLLGGKSFLYDTPFTPFPKMILQCLLFLVYDDALHYATHRTLHTPWLYKRIHKLHHRYSSTFCLATEYGHPIEVVLISGVSLAGVYAHAWIFKDVHMFTILVYINLRLWQAIDSHSGYDFPWSLNKIIPFWGGAEFHDFHHLATTSNYAPSFRWWDRIMGTDQSFRAHRERVRAAQKKIGESQEASLVEEDEIRRTYHTTCTFPRVSLSSPAP